MIGTKLCNNCGLQKPLANFYKNSVKSDGLQTQCKECQNAKRRKYHKDNLKEERAKHRRYYEDNKEKLREQSRKYRHNHPRKITDHDRILARVRYARRTEEQKERDRIYKREYQRAHKDKVKIAHKKYRDTHKKELKEYNIRYREENRAKINKRRLDRLHNDPVFKLKEQTRNMLRCSFRTYNHRKTSHTKDIVGCDLDFLCSHLKQTWKDRYHTDWNGQSCHIDHIVPLSTAKTKEDIISLCHYTNLQLLTPKDNMLKSDKSPR